MESKASLAGARWVRAAGSDPAKGAVETALLPDGSVAMRNSAYPDGPVLVFTALEWAAFIGDENGGVVGGEFDDYGQRQ